jgi:hypothetical protein
MYKEVYFYSFSILILTYLKPNVNVFMINSVKFIKIDIDISKW